MTKVKEDIQLIDYLKEKGISTEELKAMIEESIKTETEVIEKEKGKEDDKLEEEPQPDPEEVPSFTIDDVKKLVNEEVKTALKIKRKVPSKGKIVDKDDIQKEPASQTKRDVATKDWFEVLI